jgi:outer membrane biosynthesis protein TonB
LKLLLASIHFPLESKLGVEGVRISHDAATSCNACASLLPVALQAEMTTQATTDAREESPKKKTKNIWKEPAKKKKQENDVNKNKKKMSEAKKHQKATKLVPTKLKKYVPALLFWIAVATKADTGSANHEECLFSYR